MKKPILIFLLVSFMALAGCSAQKQKSTSPILLVFDKTCTTDGNASFSLLINENGEYFTVGPNCTYTLSEFGKLSDVPSYMKSGVASSMYFVDLKEYEVEGELFTAEEMKEIRALLGAIPADVLEKSVSMPEYDMADFAEKQVVTIHVRSEGREGDSLRLLALSNREEGGERPFNPNTFIGDFVDDENSTKLIDMLLEKVPLKDLERDYYLSYPEYVDE